MINVLQLRSRIATALSGQIGTYTFSSGQSIPALRVEGTNYPENPSVTGLEVVIRPEIETPYTPHYGDGYQLDCRSEILLKQWDIEETTIAARDTLLQTCKDLIESVSPRVVRDRDLDTVEQVTLTLSQPFINLS